MSHGFDITEAGVDLKEPEYLSHGHPLLVKLDRFMRVVNRGIMVPCMLALFAARQTVSRRNRPRHPASRAVLGLRFPGIATDLPDIIMGARN